MNMNLHRYPFGLLCCVFGMALSAQWTASPIAQLPMPSANHAFCAAQVNGNWYAYAFGGITTGLTNANIHRQAFRYDVLNDVWAALPDIPDTLGKIAAAASVVGDTAYVIGGYHVFSGPPFELSSNRVHRLDLTTDTWMPDGAPVPVPIDDQVQAVWRDSLIYVITGWSNTTNVANVQVYDPALNSWSVATPVPNTNQYKAFGASGVIIGDTIYYHGGAASSGNFPAQSTLRLGHIDPANPLNITWLPVENSPYGARYRSGAVDLDGSPAWLGGSAVSYNYDAIAYNGSGVVVPVTAVPRRAAGGWSQAGDLPMQVMDLRGVGELGGGQYLIAGGIGMQQNVLDSAWIIQYTVTGLHEMTPERLNGYPNPAWSTLVLHLPLHMQPCVYRLHDCTGRTILTGRSTAEHMVLDVSGLLNGSYVLHLASSNFLGVARVQVAHHAR